MIPAKQEHRGVILAQKHLLLPLSVDCGICVAELQWVQTVAETWKSAEGYTVCRQNVREQTATGPGAH